MTEKELRIVPARIVESLPRNRHGEIVWTKRQFDEYEFMLFSAERLNRSPKNIIDRMLYMVQMRPWSSNCRSVNEIAQRIQTRMMQTSDTDVSLFTIHKWIGGVVRPTFYHVELLAKVFEVEEEWLSFGG